jgi:hypothetical protein
MTERGNGNYWRGLVVRVSRTLGASVRHHIQISEAKLIRSIEFYVHRVAELQALVDYSQNGFIRPYQTVFEARRLCPIWSEYSPRKLPMVIRNPLPEIMSVYCDQFSHKEAVLNAQ